VNEILPPGRRWIVPPDAKKSSRREVGASELETLAAKGFPGRWLIDLHSKDSFTIRKFE
jgi:hypothetical protein